MNKINTSYSQQYSKKTSLLSQQTGKNGKKVQSSKTTSRKNTKKNKYR